jgi:hypothetical protein
MNGWRLATTVGVILGLGSAFARAALASGTCAPLRLAPDPTELPDDWRSALEDLRDATSREGHPWSCTGGEASLTVHDAGGAVLRVITGGREMERRVGTPDDVVPMGEALLAAPLPPAAMVRASDGVPRDPGPGRDVRSPVPTPAASGRGLEVQLSAGLGYLGPTAATVASGTLRGSLSFEAWEAGIWARLDEPLDFEPPGVERFSLDAGSVGLSAGRRFIAAPMELYVGFEPSVAVVAMEGGPRGERIEGARVDARLGLCLCSAVAISRRWRIVASAFGEFAPAELSEHRIAESFPPVPGYAVGLSLGLGALLR